MVAGAPLLTSADRIVTVPGGRAWAVCGVTAYVLAFHLVYVGIMAQLFAYSGLIYDPVDELHVVLAGVIAVVPSLWLPLRISRPSQVCLWLIYMIGYVPPQLVAYYALHRGLGDLWPFTAVLLGGMSLLIGMDRIPRTYWVVPLSIDLRTYSRMLLLTAAAAAAYVALTVGINLQLPSLSDIYDTRAAYGEELAASGGLVAYAVVWSANVIGPLLIALGLRQRRFALLVVGILLELMIYGVTGFKTALFASFLVVTLFVLLLPRRGGRGDWLPWLASGAIGGAVLVDQYSGSIEATSIFVRRLLEIPGLVTAYYFEFFSDHRPFHLAHSFLGAWFQQPSELTPPQLIGSAYFGPRTWANGGLWADGLANFGYVGVLAFSGVLGAIFWVLDVVADGTDIAITGPVVGIFGFVLSNSGLFTTILSHGLAFAILALALLPRLPATIRVGERVARNSGGVPYRIERVQPTRRKDLGGAAAPQ